MNRSDETHLEEVLLPEERTRIRDFLAEQGLLLEEGLERTVALRRGTEILATGSVAGSVIKCVAVAPSERGRNRTAPIVTDLLVWLHRRGRQPAFLFTSPESAPLFQELGFRTVGCAPGQAVLLEHGRPGLEDHLAELATHRPSPSTTPVGSVVVNCNPFTLGHRALIERAASDCPRTFVLVVQEDRSSFPFPVRLELVQKGTADLPGVVVLPGGPYIISGATFPNYFLKESDRELLQIQTRLDLDIFVHRIAPALGIQRRYVGQEPLCPVTRAYNEAMLELLDRGELELRIMDRTQIGDRIISASAVRSDLVAGDWETVRAMVPPTTLEYLESPEAEPVIRELRRRQGGRH